MIAIMQPALFDLLSRLPHESLRLSAGEMLFQQHDPVRRAFAVSEGLVHLLRRQEDGAEFLLQRAGPGALVAEASVLSACYHCTAEAAEDSRLTSWALADIRALLERDGTAALAFAAHLAAEVRSARLRAEIVSLRRVADRLDAWLAWHEEGLPDKGAWHHVAREISVSPEALYREIARRRRMGNTGRGP